MYMLYLKTYLPTYDAHAREASTTELHQLHILDIF